MESRFQIKSLGLTGLLVAAFVVALFGTAFAAGVDARGYTDVLDVLRKQSNEFNDPIYKWKFTKDERCDDRCLEPGIKGPKWKPANWGLMWHEENWAGYFQKKYVVPENVQGRDITGSKAYFYIEHENEAYVYVDGEYVRSVHRKGEVFLKDNVQPGDVIWITMKITNRTDIGLLRTSVVRYEKLDVIRNRTQDFVTQVESIVSFIEYAKDPEKWYGLIEEACAKIDLDAFEKLEDEKYLASINAAESVFKEFESFFKEYDIYLVGYSHIDLAWLWPWSEGEEVTRSTSRTVMQLMKEYPNFVYCQTQSHGYKWLEDDYPDVFEEIKKWYKEGRWEINGGTWSEHDSNVPGGEGMVRQFLYGKRYLRDRFGKDVIVGWTPDSFGYNWNLPQFLKKSGMIGFLTQKIGWNDTTKFPYNLFWWEGVDGSRIMTYFPVGGYGELVHGPTMLSQLKKVMERHNVKEHLVIFGVGDHGGGVTRQHLERAKALEDNPAYPNVHYTTSENYFKHLSEIKDKPEVNFPVWNDELYLEYHRGTYTTQANTKKNNRLTEILMENAEKFASVARMDGMEYPKDTIFNGWYWIMLNHMHDILPGSGIREVYQDADRDYGKTYRYGRSVLNESLNTIAKSIDTQGPGVPLVLFNPLGWQRDGVVETPIPGLSPRAQVVGPDGRGVPCQVVEEGAETHILFVARNVPAVGYAVYHVLPDGGGPAAAATSLSADAEKGFIENDFVKLAYDTKSGYIKSLVDKKNGNRELLDPKFASNMIQVYKDTPENDDAWNIKLGEEYRLDRYGNAEIVEEGPVRITAKITYRVGISTFHQYVSLVEGMPIAYGRIIADWQERHNMAKLAFNFNIKNDTVWYNIPYAAISRKSIPKTLAEKAKREHCGQKWVDFSNEDGAYGVTIVNEAKYGYDANNSTIRMSLLRSPTYPDPLADRGAHDIKYALVPHTGNWSDGHAPRSGHEYNYPLLPMITTSHAGDRPAAMSFFSVEPAGAVSLSVVKKAEDDGDVVIRLVELEGRDGVQAKVTLPFDAKSIAEVNLIEDPMPDAEPGTANGRTLIVPLDHHEIKTIKITK